MADFLLKNHPELLLGGDPVGPCSLKRCRLFWQRFHKTHPNHVVFDRFGSEDLGRVIPLCMHGDNGRTKRKSPIAVYSFEAVFGLPEGLRQAGWEPGLGPSAGKQKKYETGQLSQTCGQRRAALSLPRPTLAPDGACALELQHEDPMEAVQTHNTLGQLAF